MGAILGTARTPARIAEGPDSMVRHTPEPCLALSEQGGPVRSRMVRHLVWFWGSFLGVAGVGAAILEVLGPPHTARMAMHELASASPAVAGPITGRMPVAPASAAPAAPNPAVAPAPARAALDPTGARALNVQAPAVTISTVSTVVDPHSSNGLHAATDISATSRAASSAPLFPEMVTLPGGMFRMGSNDDPSERPVHAVIIAPFFLARYAVTVREWRPCAEAGACTLAPDGEPDQPVTNASWDDAQQFVAWLSAATGEPYRLPTEAEWEYAARAGTRTRYWWGDAMQPGKASCKGCGGPVGPEASPRVDAYPLNPFGLYGMGGGAAEWVADCWHRDYQGAPRDGSAAWDAPDCQQRVLRGGSWMDKPGELRTSSREFYDAPVRYPTHGFRVARAP
jgi:formylglycine-generating enzyme required for sulfatase activity